MFISCLFYDIPLIPPLELFPKQLETSNFFQDAFSVGDSRSIGKALGPGPNWQWDMGPGQARAHAHHSLKWSRKLPPKAHIFVDFARPKAALGPRTQARALAVPGPIWAHMGPRPYGSNGHIKMHKQLI